MVVSGLALFFGSLPIPGTINWVGGNRTEAETARAARWRSFWRWAGLVLMVGGAVFQISRLVGPSHQLRANPNEEWGVVVVHFGSGPSLWGLFESKAECLQMRQAYRAIWGETAGSADEVKREPPSRTLILRDRIPVTFSCLPLSEIRGLALDHDRPSN